MISEKVTPEVLKETDPYKRLAAINRAITTSLNSEQVFNLIVENATELVRATGSLLLLVDGKERFRIRASFGVDENVKSFSGEFDEDVISQLHKIPSLRSNTTLASLPIVDNNTLKGLLVVVRESPLKEEEEWQLSVLADQAAIALRNARQYEMEIAEVSRERDESLLALRASNARINRILESITDLFYSLDRQWRFTDVNRQTELRFGKSRQELLGTVIWELFPQARESALFPNFRKAMDQRVAVSFELESNIVSGAWFEGNAYPSENGITVYLRDITERKEAERTGNLLAAIVESSDDAIISKDLNGVISSWNKGAQRIFGYNADEVIGKPVTILMPPDRINEEPGILARILSGLSVDHYDTVRQRKDGQLIDISLTVSPVRNDAGVVIGASKVARDITEQKRAQREILFQARLLTAVEQAVIATDLDGKVIFWNRFAEKLYGWTTDEALGSNIAELTPARKSKEQAEEIFLQLKSGRSWSGEMLLQRRDGSEFPAMITDSPIADEKGNLIGVVGVSVDISEVKRADAERTRLLEAEREARAEAETANRLKDEFLATLSHELRNPLNVVIGYSEILRRGNGKHNQAFIMSAADVIRRNALAQSQLVSDLLDLSRLQMGKLTINQQPVSLSTVVTDAIETVKAEAEARNITLNLDFGTELLVVDGDPIRLGQIAWNLMNNAVKFTPAGGQITISLTEDHDYGKFSVSDTGQGIPPEFLPHVFEIFRQADGSSSRRQGGLGIGLALVKQLTELHGGRVTAESEGVGKGARFVVWLPLERVATSESDTKNTTAQRALAGKRILVIDDSMETTDMLSSLLEMAGAEVQAARSGIEALDVAQGRPFDLIVSDISMPEMDGYQLLQKLRTLPSMTDVPAIALTGYGRISDVRRAKQVGFSEHFTKPLNIEKLLATVHKLTQQIKEG